MSPQPIGETTKPAIETFTFDLMDDNYLIIEVGGYRLLLDTGSPFSFRMPSGPQELEFLGGRLRPKEMPFSETYLNEGFGILGIKVDILVGLNVLRWFGWEVDRAAGMIRATIGSLREEPRAWMPLDVQDGPPIVTLDDGTMMILDSGAALSYRIGGAPAGAEQVGYAQDWSLLWGTIQTPVWESTLRIGGMEFPVRYGKLPDDADQKLAWMLTGWIIGGDLSRSFRVWMDFRNGRLGLRPLR